VVIPRGTQFRGIWRRATVSAIIIDELPIRSTRRTS
jgi:hypothetical protein